jgi:peptidoglycan/LPS O-acetylase OafA/YrhL
MPDSMVEREPSMRVLELDGLRALAILPVIFHHCCPSDTPFFTGFGEIGWVGVDLFFVLSGFLITGILLRTRGGHHYYRNFIIRRTLRIFPLYYLCLGLFTIAIHQNALAWEALKAWGGPGWFFVYLGNLRLAWVNQYPPVFSFVPLWSLQVEEQFYLLFPLIVATLSTESLRRFLIWCIVTAPALRIYLILAHHTAAAYVLMPSRMDSLALGGLVAIGATLPVRLRFDWIASVGIGLTALMFFVVIRTTPSGTEGHPFVASIGYSLVDLTSAAVLSYLLVSPKGKIAAALRWRPLTYTGQIAYGLYLLHGPASWAARGLIGRIFSIEIPGHSWLSVPVTFGASFVAAGLTWKYFERPMLGLKDRFTTPLVQKTKWSG